MVGEDRAINETDATKNIAKKRQTKQESKTSIKFAKVEAGAALSTVNNHPKPAKDDAPELQEFKENLPM